MVLSLDIAAEASPGSREKRTLRARQ